MGSVNYNIDKSNQMLQKIQGPIQILQEVVEAFSLTTAGSQLNTAAGEPRGDVFLWDTWITT